MSKIIYGLPPTNEMEVLGKEMREVALDFPCNSAEDALNRDFFRFLAGKYSACLVLEQFLTTHKDPEIKLPPPPTWHCSINILHEITHGSNATFGLGDQAILVPSLWNEDDKKDVREIMGYLLGAVILFEDQPVIELPGLYAYHWYTPAASKYAKEHYGRARENAA